MLDTEKELLREKIQEALAQQSQEQKVRPRVPTAGKEWFSGWLSLAGILLTVFSFVGNTWKVPAGGSAEE